MTTTSLMHRGRGGLAVAAAAVADPDASRSAVQRMLAAAPHRGGHHRVAHSGTGAVGISGDDGVRGLATAHGSVLGFAGLIDNAEAFGVASHADGDDLALALLTAVQGDGHVSVAARMRGLYAVVIIGPDGTACWRDHVGFAPLFWRKDAQGVWIATEAKQVVAGAGIRLEPDLEVVADIFLGSGADDTPSALAGVSRVPRMRVVEAGAARQVTRAFWDPESILETSDLAREDLQEAFDTLMDQAVRRVMRGPDAISLSGGVDSPGVAAYAAPAHREMFGTPLGAVSSIYPDQPAVDESELIAVVAQELGLTSHVRALASRPTDDLARWVALFDGPFPVVSVAESEEFYRWAVSLEYRVLLTGELAEYLTEMSTYTAGHLLWHLRPAAYLARVRRERSLGRPPGFIARSTLKAALPDPLLHAVRGLRRSKPTAPRPAWMSAAPPTPAPKISATRRWSEEQLSFFGGTGVLLEAHDAITALCRIDVRRPFADIDLWEAMLGLRAEVKHGNPARKGLLRELLRGRAPDPIIDRKDKTVFDDSLMARIDYAELERWLVAPNHRLPWIDYDLLQRSLDARSVDLREFMWMKDLAAVHAFLDQW